MGKSEQRGTPGGGGTLFERLGGRPGILHLLRHFYADVRQHEHIGPIFTAHIEDWPAHLEKIADFWSGATGGPSRYRGPMPAVHAAMGLEEVHFEVWLSLWRRNCHIHLGPQEAAELVSLAEAIGERLQSIVRNRGAFFRPE